MKKYTPELVFLAKTELPDRADKMPLVPGCWHFPMQFLDGYYFYEKVYRVYHDSHFQIRGQEVVYFQNPVIAGIEIEGWKICSYLLDCLLDEIRKERQISKQNQDCKEQS